MQQTSKKKTAATVIAAIIIVALVVLSVTLSDRSLTENQRVTMRILLIVCGSSVLYCFIVGEIAQNFSQMDKLWSILPIAYAWIVAARGGMKIRLLIYALIVTAWGIRLTVNFARKGAYSLKFWTGKEDYRWSIVHKFPIFQHRVTWTLFDLLFISFYQNALVLAITFPALAVMESTAPFGVWEIVAIVLALGSLTIETVADEYQWAFQQKKRALQKKEPDLAKLPRPYDLGFNTTGPWSRMRHPNYLGEQGIWLSLYLFTIGAGVTRCGVFHWSAVGPLLLVFLFMGSSALGESISSKKYPRYADYIDQVFKYLPIRRFKRNEDA